MFIEISEKYLKVPKMYLATIKNVSKMYQTMYLVTQNVSKVSKVSKYQSIKQITKGGIEHYEI